MAGQLLLPVYGYALSSGPVQPEIQSFEPVGTTDMVDLFTGDFVYNIPLMDVEGYPVNISYHGGVTMDQEASWVGLGWNINPGAVNRSVRGLPDDFAGEQIEKELNVKPEVTLKAGTGLSAEVGGLGQPEVNLSASLGGYLNINNYRGISVDLVSKAGVNAKLGPISAGMNIGASFGSQAGASFDYSKTFGIGVSGIVGKDIGVSGGFNINKSGVYSPRSGLRQQVGMGFSASVSKGGASMSMSSGTSVPIGLNNYTAALSNSSYMTTTAGQLKAGTEAFWVFGSGKISGSLNKITYDPDGTRSGYGYFNLQNATENDQLDFSRDKDVMFNTTMQLLPQTALTYDVFNVSGQGTGGSFRPFRNDFGSVYDPATQSEQKSNEFFEEAGFGAGWEAGSEISTAKTISSSGPWKESDLHRRFRPLRSGTYEDIYFKEAGELTPGNETFLRRFANNEPLSPKDVIDLPAYKPGSDWRVPRANHIVALTGKDKDSVFLLGQKQIESYSDTTGFKNYPSINKQTIARVSTGGNRLRRLPNQVTEVIQTQKEGRKYVYGLPVLNNVQRESVFSVDAGVNNVDAYRNLADYTPGLEDSKNNPRGVDHYYNGTVTPTYVTAHLLTAVLSSDYIDVSGNGLSEDDLGTYTKFNYTRKSADYRWRAPIQSGKAQYQAGYVTDPQDDKASYMIGSREQWMLHSIETKNYVAEFYVSQRKDAMGVLDRILNGGLPNAYNEAPYNAQLSSSTTDNRSYKLDSIVLYNKHTRFTQGAAAVPVKTVVFDYDYSLCKNVPNSEAGSGKLTLRKISFRYGRSALSAQSPYSFNYSSVNPDYDDGAKDRWGNYKPRPAQDFTNFEFPFTDQSSSTDSWASAWSLTEIKLPSGGVIKVDYESDDYAYVQTAQAMEMFQVEGFGVDNHYRPFDQLYKNEFLPNLYVYFKRRKDKENAQLSPKENYLNETNQLYYNVSTELKPGFYEPVKGYAEVTEVGYCPGSNDDYGYVKLAPRVMKGTIAIANPITYTALNMGRYSLPQVMFPGRDPESSDLDNILAGLKTAIQEAFKAAENPLETWMDQSKAKRANFVKSFIRLGSPGLRKQGGGHRVKSIQYYDSWDKMAQGAQSVYGRVYDYTVKRDDKKGSISSGVASYEPMVGGDELPQRTPVNYIAQKANDFPPNDPVELYQELPIGESFYPAPVVGYSQITVSSIHKDVGRSSQTEDIYGFYTARDFPIQANASPIMAPKAAQSISTTNAFSFQLAAQGFALVFNDMHGKQRSAEHWILKPVDTARGRELVSSQSYQYFMESGKISNAVPVFDYSGNRGMLSVANHPMGIEAELNMDTRSFHEEMNYQSMSLNLNTAYLILAFVSIPLGYPFKFKNQTDYRSASTMKIVQQHGILSKVISTSNGAVTETRNEVFDKETGNVLVTSVNNEYGDREYSVSYPAHWAYKELGPIYGRFGVTGKFDNDLVIDTMGADYGSRFINYNPYYSYRYSLPNKMPVGKILIDEDMGKFTLGDELILQQSQLGAPIRVWVMGFTSDLMHCYMIVAPREPYKTSSTWTLKSSYSNVNYTVAKPGLKNRLGETVQTYVTTDRSNIFPYLKDSLGSLVSLNAQTYKYNLNEVFAANKTSDSLNPFVTGKVGEYRPELQVFNLKNRNYAGGLGRTAGLFASNAYWKTETDRYAQYCPDSSICGDCPVSKDYSCPNPLDSLQIKFLGVSDRIYYNGLDTTHPHFTNKFRVIVWPNKRNVNCNTPYIQVLEDISRSRTLLGATDKYLSTTAVKDSIDFEWDDYVTKSIGYSNGCCTIYFSVKCNYSDSTFTIINLYYKKPGASTLYSCKNIYRDTTLVYSPPTPPTPRTYLPFRINKKVLLSKVGHYEGTDNENWVNASQVTRYNWYGQEIENKEEGLGYNAAIYGYNQQLPICVAKNARHSEVLYEGFEDYKILKPVPEQYQSYMPLIYSPFEEFFKTKNALDAFYAVTNTAPAGASASVVNADAHTGFYALNANATTTIPLNGAGTGASDGYTFLMKGNRRYYASVWLKPNTPVTDSRTTYNPNGLTITMDTTMSATASAALKTNTFFAKTNLIEGWQKYEIEFSAPAGYRNFRLNLPGGYLYDDLRIHPFESNTKAFVYDENTRRLMATLDENNFASFYEYDAEGSLIRTKKETEKGVLTITESRSNHQKKN
ncbi:hypothetical protein GCM10023092_06330 [Rurimicrobium arvi]|uniref:PA14 domain-containing protein n=2 Tax=Rurimicrobium arvi TaxID=2049916 RepID=A0ABP8MJF8_9BACT